MVQVAARFWPTGKRPTSRCAARSCAVTHWSDQRCAVAANSSSHTYKQKMPFTFKSPYALVIPFVLKDFNKILNLKEQIIRRLQNSFCNIYVPRSATHRSAILNRHRTLNFHNFILIITLLVKKRLLKNNFDAFYRNINREITFSIFS